MMVIVDQETVRDVSPQQGQVVAEPKCHPIQDNQ